MFIMRLSLALGKTLKELSDMDARELMLWIAYYNIEPFGQDRGDVAVAINTSVLANAFAGGKRRYRPIEFMPNWEPESEENKLQRMKAAVESFTTARKQRRGNQSR